MNLPSPRSARRAVGSAHPEGFDNVGRRVGLALHSALVVIGTIEPTASGLRLPGDSVRRDKAPALSCPKPSFATHADRLRPRLEGGRLPIAGPAARRPTRRPASTRRTSTTTSPPAYATTGRDSTTACAPCGTVTCSSSGSSTASAAIWPTSGCLREGAKSYAKAPARTSWRRPCGEVGRIERSLFMIDWTTDPGMRRRAQVGLNKGEAHNARGTEPGKGSTTGSPVSTCCRDHHLLEHVEARRGCLRQAESRTRDPGRIPGPRLAARLGTHQPDRRIPLATHRPPEATRNA